jgi:hypothetical protein
MTTNQGLVKFAGCQRRPIVEKIDDELYNGSAGSLQAV